jgi:hypothetical protein
VRSPFDFLISKLDYFQVFKSEADPNQDPNETSRAPRASFPRWQDGEYGRTIPLADTRPDHGTRICHPERGTSSQLIETVAGPIATKGMLE